MLVSHGYVIKEFGSIDEVSEYIEKQLTNTTFPTRKSTTTPKTKCAWSCISTTRSTPTCSSYTTTTN